jgi:hypothetical protein
MDVRRLSKRVARNVAGAALILVGLVLWLTPIVPGGALIIPGLMLLDFPGKRRLLQRLKRSRLIARLRRRSALFARAWERLDPRRDP